jgi:protein arginine kinase activator
MLCDVCKQKKASVFLTQINKGEMHKVNLCEGCSREKGVTDPVGFGLAEALKGFTHGEKIISQPQERTCPACGMPHATFRKSGRFGCPQCYVTFADGLENLLKAMHKGTRHTGKVPAAAAASMAAAAAPAVRAGKIEELRKAQELAVQEEKFEEAARLRDEIQKLAGSSNA